MDGVFSGFSIIPKFTSSFLSYCGSVFEVILWLNVVSGGLPLGITVCLWPFQGHNYAGYCIYFMHVCVCVCVCVHVRVLSECESS